MVSELESAKSHVSAPAQPSTRDNKTSGGESRGDDNDDDDDDDNDDNDDPTLRTGNSK